MAIFRWPNLFDMKNTLLSILLALPILALAQGKQEKKGLPLEAHPEGIQWTNLNRMIEEAYPEFHLKTINGCVWQLLQKFPDRVEKPEKGRFRLIK